MGKIKRSPVWDDPRVKPPYGSVEIDRSHPLAQGLIFYSLLNEMGGTPQNLAQPYVSDLLVGSWQPSADGVGVRTAASGDHIRFPATTAYNLAGDIPWTIAFRLAKTGQSGSGADTYVAVHTDSLAGSWYLFDDNTNLKLFSNGGINQVLGPKQTNGPAHTVTAVRPGGGTDLFSYIDGVRNATVTSAGTMDSGAQALVVGTYRSDVTTLNQFGLWGWVGLWSMHALTQAENIHLHAEPYAFLRPIIRRRYFVPQAAAAASAVRRRLTLLGVGS